MSDTGERKPRRLNRAPWPVVLMLAALPLLSWPYEAEARGTPWGTKNKLARTKVDTPSEPETPEQVEPDAPQDAPSKKKYKASRGVVGLSLGFSSAPGGIELKAHETFADGYEDATVTVKTDKRVPLTFDFLGRLSPYFGLGGYVRPAIMLGGEADFGAAIGGAATLFVNPTSQYGARLAIGGGYDWLSFTGGAASGFEMVMEGSVDIRPSRSFAIGPYLRVPLAFYQIDFCPKCSGTTTWVDAGLRMSWL